MARESGDALLPLWLSGIAPESGGKATSRTGMRVRRARMEDVDGKGRRRD